MPRSSSSRFFIAVLAVLLLDLRAAHALKFSWQAPIAREDNSPLSASEISGYHLNVSTAAGDYSGAQVFNAEGSSTTSIDISALAAGTYFAVVTAIDTGGRESTYSNEVQFLITPPASPTPEATPTPGTTPNPSASPSVSPSASPSASPGCFAARDFDGNCVGDEYNIRRGRFKIKLLDKQGNAIGSMLKGKVKTEVLDTMIGYGRFDSASADSVLYVRLPQATAAAVTSTRVRLEWVKVALTTGTETPLFSFGKFGDRPIFGCYDAAHISLKLVLRTQPTGRLAVFQEKNGKNQKTILPRKAVAATCGVNESGGSVLELQNSTGETFKTLSLN